MSQCYQYSMVLRGQRPDGHKAVFRARCKQWSCNYCAVVNRRVWLARLGLEIEKSPGQAWYFWTFTLAGDDHHGDTAKSLKIWRGAWDKFMHRIKRNLPGMRYLRVFETHEDGTLHVHMLADKTYDDVVRVVEDDGRDNYTSSTCQKHLVACGLGWRHDIRPIRKMPDATYAASVAGYIGKYMTKTMQSSVREAIRDAGMGKVRMIQTSSGWAQLERDTSDVEWSPDGPVTLAQWELWQKDGIDLYDVNRREWVGHEHWQMGQWPDPLMEWIWDASERMDLDMGE